LHKGKYIGRLEKSLDIIYGWEKSPKSYRQAVAKARKIIAAIAEKHRVQAATQYWEVEERLS